jgi:shikimate dehydrogenase
MRSWSAPAASARAIAASLAGAGVATIGLFDTNPTASEELGKRLRQYHPHLRVRTGSNDPTDYDVVVNATPLGMKADDPLPMDVARIKPGTFVGEVVLKEEMTPLLRAAQAKGCPIQIGTDMLFEQIPAYWNFSTIARRRPTNCGRSLRSNIRRYRKDAR